MKNTRFVAAGHYLPERCVTNGDLEKTIDTSDSWIVERTGIRQRFVAGEGELTSDLGVAAARHALKRASASPSSIDLIIVATATPDHTFPATATAVMKKLGIHSCIAFDVQAVCAGFAYAMATADLYIKGGMARRALVIGAETFTRILDWEDRGTAVLFGDGAGAVILEAHDGPEEGVLATALGAQGDRYFDLFVDGGVSSTGKAGYLRMNGREVFRHAVARLSEAAMTVLDQSRKTIADVDWLVPHQANKRIIDAVGKKLAISPEKVMVTVDSHANTSAASIPLALSTGIETGRIKSGDLILANAMGGGFAWGAFLMRIS